MKEKSTETRAWYLRVLDKLQITDEGKVKAFGDLVVRDIERKIRDHKRNIDKLNNDLKDKLEDKEDELKDLKQYFNESFTNIDSEMTKTNPLRINYVSTFMDAIINSENNYKDKEEEIKTLREFYNKEISSIQEKIDKLEFYLSNLK